MLDFDLIDFLEAWFYASLRQLYFSFVFGAWIKPLFLAFGMYYKDGTWTEFQQEF